MRRLVRSRCSSDGKTEPEKLGATTILEKRLRVIGFNDEEVESISKALRFASEPTNNRYDKWLENSLTASSREFLSGYIDSQLLDIVSVNEREMPPNPETADTVSNVIPNVMNKF